MATMWLEAHQLFHDHQNTNKCEQEDLILIVKQHMDSGRWTIADLLEALQRQNGWSNEQRHKILLGVGITEKAVATFGKTTLWRMGYTKTLPETLLLSKEE